MSILRSLFGKSDDDQPGSVSVTADGRLYQDEIELIRSDEARKHFADLKALTREGALVLERTPPEKTEE